MTDRLPKTRGVSEILAERQGLFTELRRHAAPRDREQPETVIQPFVAITRQAGAGGRSVAGLLSEELGWPVLDRQALDAIAEEFGLDPNMLNLLDETRLSWFGESILGLVHSHLVSQDTYVRRVVKLVLVSLSEHPAIVVGRGSTAFLPRDRGLTVRLVGEVADRVALVMTRLGLAESQARRWIEKTDQERRAFVRHHFNHDPDDPMGYDLTVNTSRVGLEGAAKVIVEALRTRGLLTGVPAEAAT